MKTWQEINLLENGYGSCMWNSDLSEAEGSLRTGCIMNKLQENVWIETLCIVRDTNVQRKFVKKFWQDTTKAWVQLFPLQSQEGRVSPPQGRVGTDLSQFRTYFWDVGGEIRRTFICLPYVVFKIVVFMLADKDNKIRIAIVKITLIGWCVCSQPKNYEKLTWIQLWLFS